MRGLKGTVTVIAGGGSGIGAATAQRLAEEGCHVLVGDINADKAKEVADAITANGGSASACEFDISNEDSCAELMQTAVRTFGRLDGLFNVAADLSPNTFGRDGDILDIPVEVWRRSLDVNLTGYFYTSRHALPHMVANGRGSIVNTISGLVLFGDPAHAGYGASKAGSIALTKHIASRWGRDGVRCNLVAPGFIMTERGEEIIPAEQRAALADMLRSHRFGRPEDVAAMVAFLLSSDGEWINGQLHVVNGGTGLR